MKRIKLFFCAVLFVACSLFVAGESIAQQTSQLAYSYFESKERARVMFEESPIAQGFVDIDGRFLDVNYAFTDIVGYTENELLNLTYQEITHPKDLATDVEMANQVADGQHVRKYVMYKRYLGKWSEIIRVKLTVQGLYDENGKFLYYYIIVEPQYSRVIQENEEIITPPKVSFGEKLITFFTKNWKILIPWIIILYIFLVKVGVQWQQLTKKQ